MSEAVVQDVKLTDEAVRIIEDIVRRGSTAEVKAVASGVVVQDVHKKRRYPA